MPCAHTPSLLALAETGGSRARGRMGPMLPWGTYRKRGNTVGGGYDHAGAIPDEANKAINKDRDIRHTRLLVPPVHIHQCGCCVSVGLEGGVVSGQVQVLRPLEQAGTQIKHRHTT